MKTRQGFVSNSSSSSFIIIDYNNITDKINKLRNEYEGKPLIVDGDFGWTEFGWEFKEYYDFGSKVIFSYLQAQYVNTENNGYKGKKWLEMLEKVLKDNLDVTEIIWKITTEYNYENKDNNNNWAYIDHQSASYEGENTEMFNDEESLKYFLFSTHSYIKTGNDNI